MRRILLTAIRAYQRYLSPYKGFGCAYRLHTGRLGCSALGYRAIRRYGIVKGLSILRRRTYLCGVAHRRYAASPQRPPRAQRGDCDLGCDLPMDFAANLPGGKSCSNPGSYVSCCDCGSCDWPDRKKNKEQERGIHLPPRRRPASQRG
uniref:membrane protein insertion efficiency factor YidD n=1 Tax=Hylemonella sp. TaxID=2066020 RepID=UPI003451BAF6